MWESLLGVHLGVKTLVIRTQTLSLRTHGQTLFWLMLGSEKFIFGLCLDSLYTLSCKVSSDVTRFAHSLRQTLTSWLAASVFPSPFDCSAVSSTLPSQRLMACSQLSSHPEHYHLGESSNGSFHWNDHRAISNRCH